MDARNNTSGGDLRRPSTRKHMGVATNDPEYLPPTGPAPGAGRIPPSSSTLRIRANERGGKSGTRAGAPDGSHHYERYLQTPKKGRSIFTSQQQRQRKRTQALLAVLILAAVALALVWFFILR